MRSTCGASGPEGAVALRVAGAEDAEAIRTLVHEAYAKWVPVIGRLPLPMQADYAAALLRHRFDLLQAGDPPGGPLLALIETVVEDDHLLIVNVAVGPAVQGRGYGVRLLRLAQDRAAALGLSGLRLYTNRKYTENLRLYARLGYAVEREEPYAGPGARAGDVMVYMRLGLPAG